MTNEVWKPVVGAEGRYEVSDHGRVRSLDHSVARANGRTHRVRGRELKPATSSKWGHQTVTIQPRGSVPSGVHVLVMAAFVGERPAGMEVAHLDGNPANNHVTNLAYVTHPENCSHRVIHGTASRGDDCPTAKLTSDDVGDMRWLRGQGVPTQQLGELFGVSARQVRRICSGERWAHL